MDANVSSVLVVRPVGPLAGRVVAGGAKNSALKLMAACLLAEGRHVLEGVPRITDVDIMAELLEQMGARVERAAGGSDLVIDVTGDLRPEPPYDLVEKMRASVVVLGPLLGRCGYARVPMPGGDDFGERPIDIHIEALSNLGVAFSMADGYVEGRVTQARLDGTRVSLAYPSHTATDNILMASVLARGRTVIENAAREPEVVDLVNMLISMGAQISGAGTSRIVVDGVEKLEPARHRVIPDRIVAATFLAATAICGGDVTVVDARAEHMEMFLRKLAAMGVQIERGEGGLRAVSRSRPSSVDVATLPYPGVATDYAPLIVAILSRANGVGIVSENLFPGRFRYMDELRKLGADISNEGYHAVVRGVDRLRSAHVAAPDLRGGAALVLAGLAADGETVVSGVEHIDRGYEDLEGKLVALGGARVERIIP